MTTLSDYELVRLTCSGTVEAFSILVQRYRKPLMALSQRYAGDPFSAEDIVQESFLKAFEKLQSFQFRAAFKSWIYRIAINTAKNRYRKKRPTVEIDKVLLSEPPKSEILLIENQLKKKMRECIEQLPTKQRMALQLRVYEGLSFKEVAEQMKCPYDTAKANYRHGMIKVRSIVGEECG